jgi:hypothetical protein
MPDQRSFRDSARSNMQQATRTMIGVTGLTSRFHAQPLCIARPWAGQQSERPTTDRELGHEDGRHVEQGTGEANDGGGAVSTIISHLG